MTTRCTQHSEQRTKIEYTGTYTGWPLLSERVLLPELPQIPKSAVFKPADLGHQDCSWGPEGDLRAEEAAHSLPNIQNAS